MKKTDTTKREDLLKALYSATSKSNLVSQFDTKLTEINAVFKERKEKLTKEKRYTYLLEQIVYFSHAVIYGHNVQTAHNYRATFLKTAKDSTALNLNTKDVEKAFSFLNRTIKSEIKKDKATTSTSKPSQDDNSNNVGCVAQDEIKRLKGQLDTKEYELKKGQLADDKETFIKIAILSLATGIKQSDILEDIEIKDFKPSFIIGLDLRTVRRYLKEVREHYDYSLRAKKLKMECEKSPTDKNLKKHLDRVEGLIGKENVDVKTGIRKALRALGIPKATNTNALIALHRECQTSSRKN